MKTLVVGANGKIGRLFCESAASEVVAMVRDPQQQAFFEERGIASVLADLEADFAHAFDASGGCDRVVFTAGSGGRTGGDKTLLIDLYGAIRTIEESERRGVSHYVMVSAMRADEALSAPAAMRHYFVAKMLADRRLRESSVPYTVLRPGRLTDTAGSGSVRTDLSAGKGVDISRANVAACIAAALASPASKGLIVDLLDGELPIDQLFAR
jgi:uncharacterized protein YbjT (DUF2867 family)